MGQSIIQTVIHQCDTCLLGPGPHSLIASPCQSVFMCYFSSLIVSITLFFLTVSKIQDKEVLRNDILLERKCIGVHTSIFCCMFVCIYVFVIKVLGSVLCLSVMSIHYKETSLKLTFCTA